MNTKQKAAPNYVEIEAWLCAHLAHLLSMAQDEIDIDSNFHSYGLASVEGVKLVSELEQMLKIPLSPTLVWDYPTIAALARFLAGATDAQLSEQMRVGAATTQPVAASTTPAPEGDLIAIVGMGCRYPGAENLAALWRLLCQGEDAITEIPAERWDVDAYYHPDRTAPGKMTTRWGGFLPRLDEFDAHFFGISPREAPHVDPRQRLLLEVTWEALEDAGIPPDSLAGSLTGVFVANLSNDYDQLLTEKTTAVDANTGPGTANSILANRISYWLDLRGPSFTLDTACSGSLVAIHLACQSLQRGEITLALVGGVNLNLLPKSNLFFTKAGALAADGRCKTFDEGADGIVRSDGAGLIVLKPLAQARADGDPVYAVIRGSAINHDGRTNGIMAPNGLAQQQLLRAAYRNAGVSPGQIQYIEAHGTGTSLGDPIEVKALGAVLTENREPDHRCALGSIKTNIGHTEAAAGMAGIIKTALAIHHRLLPACLHFQRPNPLIPFDTLPFTVQQTLGPWPSPAEPLLAGVSGFGFGGTNAHVVLAEPDFRFGILDFGLNDTSQIKNQKSKIKNSAQLIPLSARTPEALRALAQSYHQLLVNDGQSLDLADIGYTASLRRSHHSHRLALVAHATAELVEKLDAYLQKEAQPAVTSPGKLAFVFSGQGSHWLGMGRELAAKEPVFRATLAKCDELLQWFVAPTGGGLLGASLLDELAADEAQSRLNQTDMTQPAIFAIQVALADLWRSWGVTPAFIVGHSLGEVAAAYAAGVLTLEEAVQVVYHRSRLMKTVAGQGKTAVVGLSLAEARRALVGYEDLVDVAGSNSPTTSVLSGDPVALERILADLAEQKVFCRVLAGVDVAFHSPHMDPLRGELVEALEGLAPRAATIPIFSTVTGAAAEGSQFDAAYWGKNLRNPFLFTDVMEKLLALGCDTFLEVSPHPVLAPSILQNMQHQGREGVVLASLRRHEAEQAAMLTTLGALYTQKRRVDWRKLYPAHARHVALPTYPWQRTRYWLDQLPGTSSTVGKTPGAHPRLSASVRGDAHPLLGEYREPANRAEAAFWEGDLGAYTTPYLADHRALGAVLLPGAAYVEMALAASRQANHTDSVACLRKNQVTIRELVFEQALRLPTDDTVQVQVMLSPKGAGESAFQVYSRSRAAAATPNAWTRHAGGAIEMASVVAPATLVALAERKAHCTEEITGAAHYAEMAAHGLAYGPSFQPIQQIWRRNGEAISRIELGQHLAAAINDYQLHPVLLDAGFQTVAATLPNAADNAGSDAIYLPHSIAGLRFYARPGAQVWCHARLHESAKPGFGVSAQPNAADLLEADLILCNEDGEVAVAVDGLRLQRLNASQPVKQKTLQELLYTLQWQPQAHMDVTELAQNRQPGHWLILADRQGVGRALATRLTEQGESCMLIHSGSHTAWRAESREGWVNPAQPGALQRLLQEVLPNTALPCRGIVHLWSLDAPALADMTTAGLAETENLGCTTILHLVQTLAAMNLQPSPRLWLITQNAQAVGEETTPLAVAQSPLWGMGRVIALEHPELWGGLVDLGQDDLTTTAALLANELGATVGETQVAFRLKCASHRAPGAPDALSNRERYVARLNHCAAPDKVQQPFKVRADGSYLVTGGLSGLGRLVAHWLVQQGARRLILLGRTELPPRTTWGDLAETDPAAERVAAIRALENQGASVHYAAVDVADEAQLTAYLDQYRREGYPVLRGVVHSAGVLSDQLLLRMDQAALQTVLRPKINGAWALHQATQTAPLDFFVLFSSASALLGQYGQANYAAGNAFMDALAHYRRAQGLPGLSINWGPWAEVGMFARLDTPTVRSAVTALTPQQGLQVLAQLLERQAPQTVVIDADWQRMPPSPLLAEVMLKPGEDVGASADRAEEHAALMLDLLLASPAERRALLETQLRVAAARVFQLAPAQVDIDVALPELGLDSIMAVELKNQIEKTLGVTIPIVDLFTSSVALLIDKVDAQIQTDDELAALLAEVEELPLDAVDGVLAPA